MSLLSAEYILKVLDTLYEAATVQDRWFDAVKMLRDLFGGSRACILHFGSTGIGTVSSVDDPELSSPASFKLLMSEPLAVAQNAMPVGIVHHRSSLVDETAFRQRPIYNDLFRPRDMYEAVVCKLHGSATASYFFDVSRGPSQERFDRKDIDLMSKLVPHMMRAGEINRRIGAARMACAEARSPATLIVDGNRIVSSMNAAAELLLARADGPLTYGKGIVGASDPASALKLRQLVENVSSMDDAGLSGAAGSLATPLTGTSQGFAISVAPCPGEGVFGVAPRRFARIIVTELVSEVNERFELHAGAVLGLTPGEARLAGDIANGLSLAESARRKGVGINTVRTHLANIYRKTGTHHQGQLVALLKGLDTITVN